MFSATTISSNHTLQEAKTPITFDVDTWTRKQHQRVSKRGVGGLFESGDNNRQCLLFIPIDQVRLGGNPSAAREYEIQITFNKGNVAAHKLKVLKHSAPAKISSGLKCPLGNLAPTMSQSLVSPSTASAYPRTANATGRTLVLSVDADSRFFSFYKGNTANIIAVVLQRVNQIYSNQLGISLRLGSLTIHSSKTSDPFAATFSNSNDLLDNYLSFVTTFPVASTDAYHLFTGKRGFLDAIGLSFIGAVCGFPNARAAWSEYAQGFFWFSETVAHEIGHNVGANHDLNDIRSIMSVVGKTNLKNPYFSAASIAEIETNLTSNGDCLIDASGSDLPTPGSVKFPPADESPKNITISISIRRGKSSATISGVVKNKQGKLLSGRVVQIVNFNTNSILATTLTKSKGNYSFKVTNRGRYFVDDRLGQKGSSLVRF